MSPAPSLRRCKRRISTTLQRCAAGKLLGAGPFTDQSDDSFRGICFYACPLAEARELVAADPSVQAGRLAFDAMTWLTPAGTVDFPDTP
jgi:hypothetical protein